MFRENFFIYNSLYYFIYSNKKKMKKNLIFIISINYLFVLNISISFYFALF
jgi:hypothetical protein